MTASRHRRYARSPLVYEAHGFVGVKPESGVRRSLFQQHMEAAGIDTRMVWTGNVTRQPAFKNVPRRVGPGGLHNADVVMETGLILPCNHAIDDEGIDYMCYTVDQFFNGAR